MTQLSTETHSPRHWLDCFGLGMNWPPPAAKSLVLKLIPVSDSKVLLLLESVDKHNEEVLVVE